MLDISPDKTRIVISSPKEIDDKVIGDVLKTDKTIDWNIFDFSINEFTIENIGNNL